MILGLCSSFAVLPAFSLVHGGGGTRRAVGPAQQPTDGTDQPESAGPEGLAALVVANAALAAGSRTAVVSGTAAAAAAPKGGVATATLPAAKPVAPPVAFTPPTPPSPPPAAVAAAAAVPHGATAGRGKLGVASWLDISPGTCATNGVPMGTVITVTNGSGISVTCKVVSTGPFVTGRVVDLARSTFAQLGSVSRGLVTVSVSW